MNGIGSFEYTSRGYRRSFFLLLITQSEDNCETLSSNIQLFMLCTKNSTGKKKDKRLGMQILCHTSNW